MAMAKSGQKKLESNGSNHNNKQMRGCMAGFFNFSHIISGKRINHKRLPAPPLSSDFSGNEPSELDSGVGSPALSREQENPHLQRSPETELRSPATDPAVPDSPLRNVSTFEFKEAVKSPWKFAKEAPRLSLDSRAVVDAKGGLRPRELRINAAAGANSAGDESENQRRSPCVIARLMGLELPANSTAEDKAELRRSASESRSRDYRFLDTPSFLSPHTASRNDVAGERRSDQQSRINRSCGNVMNHNVERINPRNRNQNQSYSNHNQINQRRYYNTADFFPPEIHHAKEQQQQQAVTIYGEIERRLRMRGIDEPSKDLETLKHILEALQLKGLLHSSTTTAAVTQPRRNLVSGRRESPPRRRCTGEPAVSPRRERPATARTPGRKDHRSSSPPVRRRGDPLSVETPARNSNSPVQSPKTLRRCNRDQYNQTVNRSPRGRRSTVEISRGDQRFSRHGPADDDASAISTVSESSYSTSTHTETERWRVEENREESRSLLERCDKLLHSIAEMNSNSNSNPNPSSAELQQPSPVSVLDSSFYKEDDSPSPVKKRSIHFKDQVLPELEEELWTPSSSLSSSSSSPSRSRSRSNPDHHGIDPSTSDDPDFAYFSEVYRASNSSLAGENDLFLTLEKQISSIRPQNKEEEDNDNSHNNDDYYSHSKAQFLHRKLVFDTVTEILGWAHRTKPGPERLSMGQVWAEFKRAREWAPAQAQDLVEVIVGVLRKDLTQAEDAINGWGDRHVEVSEAVLDIERLIFKDLIGESIGDLAEAGRNGGDRRQFYCRKLVF